jgi:hypothetical protein
MFFSILVWSIFDLLREYWLQQSTIRLQLFICGLDMFFMDSQSLLFLRALLVDISPQSSCGTFGYAKDTGV